MNLAPLHPQIVHLPIALAVLMPLVAGGVLLAWWRGALPRRTWWIAVALQAVLVASAVVAIRTGEADEERVEQTIPEPAIEAHEEAAEVFLFGAIGVLLLTIAAAAVPRERIAQALTVAATVGMLAVLALGYRVGRAGGSLVYDHGAGSAALACPPNDD